MLISSFSALSKSFVRFGQGYQTDGVNTMTSLNRRLPSFQDNCQNDDPKMPDSFTVELCHQRNSSLSLDDNFWPSFHFLFPLFDHFLFFPTSLFLTSEDCRLQELYFEEILLDYSTQQTFFFSTFFPSLLEVVSVQFHFLFCWKATKIEDSRRTD